MFAVIFGGPSAPTISPAAAGEPVKIAFLGFRFINDSIEPVSNAEIERLAKLEDLLKSKVTAEGKFSFVPVSPEMRTRIAAGQNPGECGGCEIDYAKELGGARVAWGNIQKVSNLILNVNLYMGDVATNKMTFIRSNDIRGNSDETWLFALDRLLKYYFLKEAT